MKKGGLFLAAFASAALALACGDSPAAETPEADTGNVGKVISGTLYIDDIRFLDANGADLGGFDSFENVNSGDGTIYCGASSSDVWQDLKAAAAAWGGQGAEPASSSLHATEGSASLALPVSMTVSATDADNYQWVGVHWATATSGGILFPSSLATALASASAASVSFTYYWAPDSSSTVSSTGDLQVDASVEWNNADWTGGSNAWYSANSKGTSSSLAAGAAASATIAFDNALYQGYATQCYEFGLGVHYTGSLE